MCGFDDRHDSQSTHSTLRNTVVIDGTYSLLTHAVQVAFVTMGIYL